MKNNFTKFDLKNGDIILERGGNVGIACPETNSLIFRAGTISLSDVNADLTSITDKTYDIIEVRRPKFDTDCHFDIYKHDRGEVVYKREETVEMTLSKVCKALGKNVKIVKE